MIYQKKDSHKTCPFHIHSYFYIALKTVVTRTNQFVVKTDFRGFEKNRSSIPVYANISLNWFTKALSLGPC